MLEDVLGQIEVDVLFQQVLGQNLHVVNGQELDERAGREGQVELNGLVINDAHRRVGIDRGAVAALTVGHLNRHCVATPQAGASRAVAGVAVAHEGIVSVFNGQRHSIVPLHVIAETEGINGAVRIEAPALHQVGHNLIGVGGIELHQLVVQLRVGNHAGRGGGTQRVPVFGVGIGRHAHQSAAPRRAAGQRGGGGAGHHGRRGSVGRPLRRQRRRSRGVGRRRRRLLGSGRGSGGSGISGCGWCGRFSPAAGNSNAEESSGGNGDG